MSAIVVVPLVSPPLAVLNSTSALGHLHKPSPPLFPPILNVSPSDTPGSPVTAWLTGMETIDFCHFCHCFAPTFI